MSKIKTKSELFNIISILTKTYGEPKVTNCYLKWYRKNGQGIGIYHYSADGEENFDINKKRLLAFLQYDTINNVMSESIKMLKAISPHLKQDVLGILKVNTDSVHMKYGWREEIVCYSNKTERAFMIYEIYPNPDTQWGGSQLLLAKVPW
jgi:hypothetical protein